MYDVITVGSATVDAFAKTSCELISIRNGSDVEHLIAYPTGSKILIDELEYMIGGGGTNTAVAFSRLGLKTGFLGKVGNDANGQEVLRLLIKEKIDFLGSRGEGQTGYSVVLDSVEDDRTILTYKGVNNSLSFSEIDKRNLKAKWFFFTSMVGRSYLTLEKLAAYAKKNNIKVGFNPSSYLARQGLGRLKTVIKSSDFLVMNKEESDILLGKLDFVSQLKRFKEMGPSIIVITDGKQGIYAHDSHGYYHLPANKVKVKETTGAGDAFASGFLAGLIQKGDCIYAMHMGMANATSVIKHLGAKNKLLTLKEATALMRKNHKVEKLL